MFVRCFCGFNQIVHYNTFVTLFYNKYHDGTEKYQKMQKKLKKNIIYPSRTDDICELACSLNNQYACNCKKTNIIMYKNHKVTIPYYILWLNLSCSLPKVFFFHCKGFLRKVFHFLGKDYQI